jgi:hypothetical protein
VQRDLTALAELAADDPQQLMALVDVVAIQPDRLAEPDPGDGHQPDQRPVRRRVQRAAQLARRVHQRGDLRGRVEVGDRAPAAGRQQPGGWQLARRVDRAQMPGELARHR